MSWRQNSSEKMAFCRTKKVHLLSSSASNSMPKRSVPTSKKRKDQEIACLDSRFERFVRLEVNSKALPVMKAENCNDDDWCRRQARWGQYIDTIRYYERRALLSAHRCGIGSFTEATVQRLRFIKHAQALGFTLNEIKQLLARIFTA